MEGGGVSLGIEVRGRLRMAYPVKVRTLLVVVLLLTRVAHV